MEPREQPKVRKTEQRTPEQEFVLASLARLKQCGIPTVRTVATWADVALTRKPAENKAVIVPFSPEDKKRFPNSATLISMGGTSPDTMHFQFAIDTTKFSGKSSFFIDSECIPYFFILAAFEKAVTAESINITQSDITYADSYRAVYQQAFELQLQYQEWVNAQQIIGLPPFDHILANRLSLSERIEQFIYGGQASGTPKIDFGIHDYLALIHSKERGEYEQLRQAGQPLIDGTKLAGNPAAKEAFLAQLSLLLTYFRPPDETFEEAIIATMSQDALSIMQDEANMNDLAALIKNSKHPLRSFIFMRAMLYKRAILHALSLYHTIQFSENGDLREFHEAYTDPIDMRLLGTIATSDLYLEQLSHGDKNYGFGENDRRASG